MMRVFLIVCLFWVGTADAQPTTVFVTAATVDADGFSLPADDVKDLTDSVKDIEKRLRDRDRFVLATDPDAQIVITVLWRGMVESGTTERRQGLFRVEERVVRNHNLRYQITVGEIERDPRYAIPLDEHRSEIFSKGWGGLANRIVNDLDEWVEANHNRLHQITTP